MGLMSFATLYPAATFRTTSFRTSQPRSQVRDPGNEANFSADPPQFLLSDTVHVFAACVDFVLTIEFRFYETFEPPYNIPFAICLSFLFLHLVQLQDAQIRVTITVHRFLYYLHAFMSLMPVLQHHDIS